MKPLILDFKEVRTDETSAIPYTYDNNTGLNMITVGDTPIPFIDCDVNSVDMMTKTRQHRENDDERFRFELVTKTEVNRERDEPSETLLELMTKTLTVRESDDVRTTNHQ